jgi:hypothetical protein
MILNNLYNIGDTVYAKTDPEQMAMLVVQIVVNTPQDTFVYICRFASETMDYQEFELSDKQAVKKY